MIDFFYLLKDNANLQLRPQCQETARMELIKKEKPKHYPQKCVDRWLQEQIFIFG